MKKVITLFLLGIFLFNTMGYFVAFKAIQYQMKNEMKAEIRQGINLPELVTITIAKTQTDKIEWLEDKEEMQYNNNRYDVVRFTETNKSITYYCINDGKEELLFVNLEKHIDTHIATDKPTKNETKKNIDQHITKLYFQNDNSLQFRFNQLSETSLLPGNLAYSPVLLETASLPPEFI